MRIFAILFLIIVSIGACKTPYFNTANNMKLITGTVYTNDGREIPGKITLNLENYRPSKLYITVLPVDAKEPEEVNVTDI